MKILGLLDLLAMAFLGSAESERQKKPRTGRGSHEGANVTPSSAPLGAEAQHASGAARGHGAHIVEGGGDVNAVCASAPRIRIAP
jgi:hypothetical protein